MMDHFKEDIVSPRAKVLSNVLYVLCWVFIVLFGGYALMMLQVVMLQFSVTALVTVLMAAVFAVLLFYSCKYCGKLVKTATALPIKMKYIYLCIPISMGVLMLHALVMALGEVETMKEVKG